MSHSLPSFSLPLFFTPALITGVCFLPAFSMPASSKNTFVVGIEGGGSCRTFVRRTLTVLRFSRIYFHLTKKREKRKKEKLSGKGGGGDEECENLAPIFRSLIAEKSVLLSCFSLSPPTIKKRHP